MINVYCFKWGDKYGPEYVNRLYASVKKWYNGEFRFHCVTDKFDGIDEAIQLVDITTFETHGGPIFTAQKIELMHVARSEHNIILDLDILIQGSLNELFDRNCTQPTFIWTHWTPEWHAKNIPAKTACFVNSSFVKWQGDNGALFYEHYKKHKERVENVYDSCDKYLFYEHHLKDWCMEYWDANYFYNYNEPGEWQYKFKEDAAVCLFNTSHLEKLGRRHYELHNTPTIHTDIWEEYDELIA